MTTLAWHNRPELKAEVVARMHAHRAADTIIQGRYQIDDPTAPYGYRGCAIGCTLPKIEGGLVDHWWDQVQRQYGIHMTICRMIDDVFEALDWADAGDFAVTVIEAIPVGADLTGVAEEIYDRDDHGHDTAEQTRDWLLEALVAAPVPEAAPC